MVAFYWDKSIMAINLKMWWKIAFTRIQTLEYTKGYTNALATLQCDAEHSASSSLLPSPSLPCSPPPALDACPGWKPALSLAILPKKPAGSGTAEADLSMHACQQEQREATRGWWEQERWAARSHRRKNSTFLTVQQGKGDVPKTEHTGMPMMRKVLWSKCKSD